MGEAQSSPDWGRVAIGLTGFRFGRQLADLEMASQICLQLPSASTTECWEPSVLGRVKVSLAGTIERTPKQVLRPRLTILVPTMVA